MTARETIEARLGRALPPTKDLRPDDRKAILLLGRQLEASRRMIESEPPQPDYLARILEG